MQIFLPSVKMTFSFSIWSPRCLRSTLLFDENDVVGVDSPHVQLAQLQKRRFHSLLLVGVPPENVPELLVNFLLGLLAGVEQLAQIALFIGVGPLVSLRADSGGISWRGPWPGGC